MLIANNLRRLSSFYSDLTHSKSGLWHLEQLPYGSESQLKT